MILLSLDASTTAVGWALFDDGEYLESGVYLPRGEDWVDRVIDIDRWLNDNGLEYDAIGFELATGNRGNMRTNRMLGAVEFVARQFCRFLDVDLYTVTASQVKATGVHKGDIQAAAWIKRENHPTWQLDPKHPGDEADAIGVALAVDKMIRESATLVAE